MLRKVWYVFCFGGLIELEKSYVIILATGENGLRKISRLGFAAIRSRSVNDNFTFDSGYLLIVKRRRTGK